MRIRLSAWGLAALILSSQATAQSEVEKIFGKVRGSSLHERIDSVSRAFLGAPYEDFPLGEGQYDAYDQAPLYRFDAFDCTTFVETVLAIALSSRPEEFERKLTRIRYQTAKPSFAGRNHFPCVDWITHNSGTGLLSDATEGLGAKWGVNYATAPVDKKKWFENLPPSVIRVPGITEETRQSLITRLRAEGKKFEPKTPQLAYIPLDKILTKAEISPEELESRKKEESEVARTKREELVLRSTPPEEMEKEVHDAIIGLRLRHLIKDVQVDAEFLAAIPSGSIMNVVRPGMSVPGTKMNVSHQGFVFQKKEGTYFRHVSRSSGRAKDVPLANYLRLCLLMPSIKGVNLLTVKERLVVKAPTQNGIQKGFQK